MHRHTKNLGVKANNSYSYILNLLTNRASSNDLLFSSVLPDKTAKAAATVGTAPRSFTNFFAASVKDSSISGDTQSSDLKA